MSSSIRLTLAGLFSTFPELRQYGWTAAEIALEQLYRTFEPDSVLITDCVSLDRIYPERGHPTQRVYVVGGKIVSSRLERDAEGRLEVRVESKNGNATDLMGSFTSHVGSISWETLKQLINKASDVQIV